MEERIEIRLSSGNKVTQIVLGAPLAFCIVQLFNQAIIDCRGKRTERSTVLGQTLGFWGA